MVEMGNGEAVKEQKVEEEMHKALYCGCLLLLALSDSPAQLDCKRRTWWNRAARVVVSNVHSFTLYMGSHSSGTFEASMMEFQVD
jgi:hypothetical protein